MHLNRVDKYNCIKFRVETPLFILLINIFSDKFSLYYDSCCIQIHTLIIKKLIHKLTSKGFNILK